VKTYLYNEDMGNSKKAERYLFLGCPAAYSESLDPVKPKVNYLKKDVEE
jgi:hypothetical protein